jgi:hypothetical protein
MIYTNVNYDFILFTMPTQIKIDPKVKALAIKKAQSDDVSFDALINLLLKEYGTGNIFLGFRSNVNPAIDETELSAYEQSDINEALEDIKKGEVDKFDSMEDLIKDLKKQRNKTK